MTAFLITTVARANATVIVPADLGELSREARAIVRGMVIAVDTRWTDDRRRVETIVTLEPESYLKGALGAALRFRVPGGQLGRYRSIVVGAPEFTMGERVVVFLGVRGPGIPYVLGLSQGVFRVIGDTAGWVVTPPAIAPVPGGSVKVVRGDPSRRPVTVAEFERRVRALVEAGR